MRVFYFPCVATKTCLNMMGGIYATEYPSSITTRLSYDIISGPLEILPISQESKVYQFVLCGSVRVDVMLENIVPIAPTCPHDIYYFGRTSGGVRVRGRYDVNVQKGFLQEY